MKLTRKIVKNQMPQITGAVRREVLRVVNETALETASIARQLCPVDTGFLRDSIALESYAGNSIMKVVVDADYAGHVEYGTRNSAAQPFLRPAIDATRSRLNRRLGQIVRGLGKIV